MGESAREARVRVDAALDELVRRARLQDERRAVKREEERRRMEGSDWDWENWS